MKKLSLLLAIPLLFSSCASIINSKYQKVSIIANEGTVVNVNGNLSKGKVKMKDGFYYLRRDGEPKQVEISKEGFKTQYFALMQNEKSKIVYASWAIGIFSLLIPPALDHGYRAFNYNKRYDLRGMISLPKKNEDIKEIKLNNFSVDLEANDFKINTSYSYKNFLKGKVNTYTAADEDEFSKGIKVKNTIFSESLNELLIEEGYIDTTGNVFKENYMQNLLIDATLSECTINIPYVLPFSYSSGGAVSTDITIEWTALDYYKTPIYTNKTKISSGEFAFYNSTTRNESVRLAIKDAIENSFYLFMNDNEVQKILKDKTQQLTEASLEELVIPKPSKYVSNIAEAVSSSVTVKFEGGHGSGFFISENGYLITNYHVVSGEKELTIILNDESEYKAEVVRFSKINDLALLKVDTKGLIPLKISSNKDIELATEIYAIGTPTVEELSQTISKGIISGIRKTDKNTKIIQTDASINAGNSGGAIVTKEGLVLGVVSSKLSGFGIEGVAFGIPAYEILEKLKISFKEKNTNKLDNKE